MSRSEAELGAMVRQAYAMPYGAAQIAAAEQLVAYADEARIDDARFAARMLATHAYTHGGEPVKSFGSFGWCLAVYDTDPVRYRAHSHHLLWHFKYVISAMRRFPEIPLERTYAVLDDMERRVRDQQLSMHAVYAYRHLVAVAVGDLAAAEDWYVKWCAEPRDRISDCDGCDPSSRAAWLARTGRDEEAIALGVPVLAGTPACTEQPQDMLTTLMLPYLRTGRHAEAGDAHRRAYRAHRPHLADLSAIAEHIKFCALTGNETRGLEIVERHLAWLDTAPSPYAAMEFAASAALLLRRVAAAGTNTRRLHRPSHGDRPAAEVRSADLAAELGTLARDIAALFDARNGNRHQSAEVEAVLSAEPIVDFLAISVTARGLAAAGAGPAIPGAVRTDGMGGDGVGSRPTDPAALAGSVVAPGRPATPVVVEPDADPDTVLDLADVHYRAERTAEAAATCDVFDERFSDRPLSTLQRGRRADLHGLISANSGEYGVAEIAWMSALDLFSQAGDEVRRQVTRSRIGQLMCRTGRPEVGLAITQDATDYLVIYGPVERRATAHRRMAFVNMLAGRAEEALASIEAAMAYADRSEDPYAYARLLVDRAGVYGETGQIEAAYDAAEQARLACRTVGLSTGLATACWISGRACEIGDRVEEALAAYDEALSVGPDDQFRTQVRRQRAGVLAGTARAAEAIDVLVEAAEDATAAGDEEGALSARHRLGVAYLNTGRPLDCAETIEEALTALDDPHALGAEALRHVLAQAYRRLGQPDQAIEQLELVAASGAHRGSPELVGEMSEQIAELLDDLDRDAAAAAKFAEAATAYRLADLTVAHLRMCRRRATSLMWAGQVDAAVEALEAADLAGLELAPATSAVIWEKAMLACDGARILTAHGDVDGAIIRIGPVIAALRSVGDTAAATYAATVHGDLLLRAGRAADAEPLLRTALPDAVDDAGRRRIAGALARCLEALDRAAEAAVIRRTHGISP
ncbi:MAG TPA: tetratricopeptide repeat protein [Micromonosporaceae bacterium]|nr:tetratricopeptide repeat protein [Micromonosporaceae bacterium]